MGEILAVNEDMKDVAGILVFWSLTGLVDIDDVLEALAAEGIPTEHFPTEPTLERVISRAAESCIAASRSTDRRLLLRPLSRRGQWDVVEEKIVDDGSGGDKLSYSELVRLKVHTVDGQQRLAINPYGSADVALAQRIKEQIRTYHGLLTASDMSRWLLRMLDGYVHATALRSRGGFYFIPREETESWRKVVRAVRGVSDHMLHEIPAVKSDEAVDAILESVRREAKAKMREIEERLALPVSTRRLNYVERELRKVQEKTARYAKLLGVALPDLEAKSIELAGAAAAARIKRAEGVGGA